ncbi:MAG: MBL fold metallo-hydrolase [Clostridia bacterium]|nr:MBL fold metallo-hydrolase [Clostridia bacterium]
MLKRFIKIVHTIIAFSAALCLLISCACVGKHNNDLQVCFLKVGKADAIVLVEDGKCLVIDTGEDDDGADVAQYIKSHEIAAIDVLIITHYDKDHIGGAERLINEFKIERAILPDYAPENPMYDALISALGDANISVERLDKPTEFAFASSTVKVEPPSEYPKADGGKETDNDSSLITTVIHGKNRFVFMGDAEKKRIRDYLDNGDAQACDLIKMPHHGDYNKALKELIERLSPKYAVICSSDKNPAESRTLDLLNDSGCSAYETRAGNVIVISSGTKLTIRQSR